MGVLEIGKLIVGKTLLAVVLSRADSSKNSLNFICIMFLTDMLASGIQSTSGMQNSATNIVHKKYTVDLITCPGEFHA
jgi:hypothetical protein